MDFSLGSHSLFEIIKCLKRIPDRPVIAGAATRLSGFVWCYCTGQKPEVSTEFIKFLREEQVSRIHSMMPCWPVSA